MGGRSGAGAAGASGRRGPHGGRSAPRPPPELALGPPAAADAGGGTAAGRDRRRDPGQRPAPGSPRPRPGPGGTEYLRPGLPAKFTSQALASFKRQQEQGFQEQSALAAEARETRCQEFLEKIAEGQAVKKQKLQQDSGSGGSQGAAGSQEAAGSQAVGENEANASQASREREEAGSSSSQPGPSDGVAPLPRSALLVQLATARPRPIKARPLDWRVQSKDWPHAGRPAHELRYSIYRDLWERGFFLSAAGKFGGDFLVYPGDPLRFHAHYIAQCWAAEDPIPLQDLVSAGRLGTSVRKTLLLCSPQPDGKVVYTSLQWAGLQ
ncbi:tRNA-splicing endonuclease subunit Sen34 isoform 1-T1 [Dugong dugon]